MEISDDQKRNCDGNCEGCIFAPLIAAMQDRIGEERRHAIYILMSHLNGVHCSGGLGHVDGERATRASQILTTCQFNALIRPIIGGQIRGVINSSVVGILNT
jgi:hypothetical protein